MGSAAEGTQMRLMSPMGTPAAQVRALARHATISRFDPLKNQRPAGSRWRACHCAVECQARRPPAEFSIYSRGTSA
jgi:hypothetical protein